MYRRTEACNAPAPYWLAMVALTAVTASSESTTLSVRMYVMKPRSYSPWATRITCDADRRSRRPPSCCRVEVMNGALGDERYGFSSTLRTAKSAGSSAVASARASASSSTTTPAPTRPPESKSRPAATRAPSTVTRRAVNGGAVALSSSMSQKPAATKAIRSRSRSTINRTDGLCTRPADRPRLTRRHSTGDTS